MCAEKNETHSPFIIFFTNKLINNQPENIIEL